MLGFPAVPDRSPCLFDWIPDEVVERIFLVGTELDPQWDHESLGIPDYLPDVVERRPYDFTARVQLTCRRFYHITKTPIAAHLYFTFVTIRFFHFGG
jgi:hypothetical protein